MLRLLWLAILFPLTADTALAGHRSEVAGLEMQRAGEITYFRVRVTAPTDLLLPELQAWEKMHPTEADRLRLRLPRLVPLDDMTRAIYLECTLPLDRRPEHLTFVGQVKDRKDALVRLLYPTDKPAEKPMFKLLVPAQSPWAEVRLTLDFASAGHLKPASGQRGERQSRRQRFRRPLGNGPGCASGRAGSPVCR